MKKIIFFILCFLLFTSRCFAAISTTGNTSGSTEASANTIVLDSWTPLAGECVLLGIAVEKDGSGTQWDVSSVAGNSLDWAEIAEVTNTQDVFRVWLWKGTGASPTEGSITITFDTTNVNSRVAIAARLSGVDSAVTEVLETDAGPAVDNRNMKDDITTLTDNAWALAVGSHRTQAFTTPGGEVDIGATITAGTGGGMTSISMWYESVASAGLVTVGGDNDLAAAIDWAQITVSVKAASASTGAQIIIIGN